MTEMHWPEGVKKTKQRQAVLQLLEGAASPLSALEIYTQLSKQDSAISLSTVYRILDLLTEKAVVTKAVVLDGEMAYYELSGRSHHHYAVCVDCRKIVEIIGCPIAEFKPELTDESFRVLGHRIEMYGYCKDCDKRKQQ